MQFERKETADTGPALGKVLAGLGSRDWVAAQMSHDQGERAGLAQCCSEINLAGSQERQTGLSNNLMLDPSKKIASAFLLQYNFLDFRLNSRRITHWVTRAVAWPLVLVTCRWTSAPWLMQSSKRARSGCVSCLPSQLKDELLFSQNER